MQDHEIPVSPAASPQERCEHCTHAGLSWASPDWRRCTAPAVPVGTEFVTHRRAICFWRPSHFAPRSPQ